MHAHIEIEVTIALVHFSQDSRQERGLASSYSAYNSHYAARFDAQVYAVRTLASSMPK